MPTGSTAGRDNVVAFMEGPVVLAGLCDNEVKLEGDKDRPATLMQPEYGQEYKLIRWAQSHYRTTGQREKIRFVPLYEVGDEGYSLYFEVKEQD